MSTPTAVAQATTPAALPSFQSGGIGLTKAAWERSHTDIFVPPTGNYITYDGGRYEVTFWQDWSLRAPTADSLISSIAFDTKVHTPELKYAAFRPFLPGDAQLGPRKALRDGDVWYSPSLVSRYPPLAGALQPWDKAEPGSINVVFKNGTSYVFIAAILTFPPRPIPVQPTPTLCGDHPCPTPTRALPTPISTPAGSPLPSPVLTGLPLRTIPLTHAPAPLPSPSASPPQSP
ncbi:MAG: hypothetical protein M3Z04_01030 [Chloroflexota bacterium]|nr:hypothetical protein [Chloroflexota bacterium]